MAAGYRVCIQPYLYIECDEDLCGIGCMFVHFKHNRRTGQARYFCNLFQQFLDGAHHELKRLPRCIASTWVRPKDIPNHPQTFRIVEPTPQQIALEEEARRQRRLLGLSDQPEPQGEPDHLPPAPARYQGPQPQEIDPQDDTEEPDE